MKNADKIGEESRENAKKAWRKRMSKHDYTAFELAEMERERRELLRGNKRKKRVKEKDGEGWRLTLFWQAVAIIAMFLVGVFMIIQVDRRCSLAFLEGGYISEKFVEIISKMK